MPETDSSRIILHGGLGTRDQHLHRVRNEIEFGETARQQFAALAGCALQQRLQIGQVGLYAINLAAGQRL
jgi:hypothetical protein